MPDERPVEAIKLLIPQPIDGYLSSGLKPKKNRAKKIILLISAIITAVVVGSGLAAGYWYSVQLAPLENNTKKSIVIIVESNSTPSQIGKLLKDKSVIRNSFAFDINTRLSGSRDKLQAGTYNFSPGYSIPQIVEYLVAGRVVDSKDIRFLPGATLNQHKKVLLDAGFGEAEIDAAFAKTYTSPIFDGKPAGADLEGYIYGDTYKYDVGDSVEEVLERTFAKFDSDLKSNKIAEDFQIQGLNLFEGITLASIVQKEASSPVGATEPSADQKQVAQVFYTRLNAGMPLGSDVTFIYAANKLGIPPVSTLDSPYNTRIVKGLPPGPISSPGITALKATAAPAVGDFVYFVAGDNGKIYFAKTLQEHEANVAKYCTTECQKQ